MIRTLLCLLAVGLTLSACAENREIAKLPSGATLTTADPARTLVRPEYKLAPTDIIEISVFNVPSLNQSAQLDSAGNINLNLIGQVPAQGKTTYELAQDLKSRYGEKYLQNPQITVVAKQTRVDTFTVDGAVQQPGVFQVVDTVSLTKAIAMARGIDVYGNPKQVVVFRNINNQRVAGVFDLTEIRAGQKPDPPIFPNDTIVVAGSGSRKALRDIIGATPLLGLLPWILQ